MVLTLFVAVYLCVALANYSLVQTFLGSYAGARLSDQWGGTVQIGAANINLFNHLSLKRVAIIAPGNDTIVTAGHIGCQFNRFPLQRDKDNKFHISMHIVVNYVNLDDACYHFHNYPGGTNIENFTKFLSGGKRRQPSGNSVVVDVGRLNMRNVRYRHDLDRVRHRQFGHGVVINHMDLSQIDGSIRNIRVEKSHVTCRIETLTATEASGFRINRLQSNVYVAPNGIAATGMTIETDSTLLMFDVLLHYRDWKTMKHYCDSVYMLLHLHDGSFVQMSDVAYWAPALWGINERLAVCGNFYGPVADLHAFGVAVAFGEQSQLCFDGYIYGLPNIDTTVIGASVYRLRTNYNDLAAVQHPRGITMKAPGIIRQLGDIDLRASFVGTVKDFYATLQLDSRLGNLAADLMLQLDPHTRRYRYLGEVSSPGFSLPYEFRNEWVSRSGFSLSFQGQSFDLQRMSASVEGELTNTVLRGTPVDVGRIDASLHEGKASLSLHLDDPSLNLALEANADMSGDLNHGNLSLNINNIDLEGLKLAGNPEVEGASRLSSRIGGRVEWDSNSIQLARLTLNDTRLLLDGRPLNLARTTLDLAEENHYKEINLSSDVCALDVKGYFEYDGIPLLLRRFCDSYLPCYYNPYLTKPDPDYTNVADTRIDLALRWNDSTGKTAALLPQLVAAPGTSLRVNFSFEEAPKLVLRSDSIGWGSMVLHDVGLSGTGRTGRYGLLLDADRLSAGNTVILPALHLGALLGDTLSDMRLVWDNQNADDPVNGRIALMLYSDTSGNRLDFDKNYFVLHGEHWQIVNQGDIVFKRNSFRAGDIRLHAGDDGSNNGQAVAFNAVVDSKPETDYASLRFDNFLLDRLAFLWHSSGVAVEGALTGDVVLRGIGNMPYFNADMVVDRCSLNDNPMGTAKLLSTWNSELNRVNLSLSTELHKESGYTAPLTAAGYYEMDKTVTEPMHFNVRFDDFDLSSVAPLLRSFSSNMEGSLSGNFDITGSSSKPFIEGRAFIRDGSLAVDFLNTVYTCSDSIHFSNSTVMLNNFCVRDTRGDSAFISGNIENMLSSDMRFNLRLRSRNFMFLNTNANNKSFYGTVFASAVGRVEGTLDDLSIEVNARTEPGSEFAIPISDRRQVKELNYIQFVNNDLTVSRSSVKQSSKPGVNYRMNLNLDVTPDMKLTLPMDFSQMKTTATATGQGDLRLTFAPQQDMMVLGDYEFSSGSLNIDFLGLISRNFSIEEGSRLNFSGALPDARFDLKAVYSQRVNLSTLTGASSVSESGTKTIPVENIIALSGTLQDPAINFDIRLPNADQSVEEEVFAYIDRSNERDMLNQTISLLVMNQFYNSSPSNTSLLDNGLSSSYAVVANSVGSVVSNMVQFVNVNFDYRAATELTTEQFDVDINKEWNKFYFETTFGFGGDTREMAEVDNTNQIVGDVLIGYKLNRRLHLFVFNRSNTNDYTRYDLPYKQGVGLKYTRDFDSWRDLFLKKSAERGFRQ